MYWYGNLPCFGVLEGYTSSLAVFLVVIAIFRITNELLWCSITRLANLGKICSIIIVIVVWVAIDITIYDSIITIEHCCWLAPACRLLPLLLFDLLEFSSSVLNVRLLRMCLLLYLACFDRISGEKVAWNVVLNAYVWCMLHLFEMLEAARLQEVNIFFWILRLCFWWFKV